MTDDEYRAFLGYLFERYIRPRLGRVRRRFHHHMMDEWDYHLDHARRAAHVLRFIEDHCDEDGVEDPYQTFTSERLARTVSDTRSSFHFANRVTEEGGFIDVLESHLQEIVRDLHPNHLPEADKEVFRDMGIHNPEVELQVLILQVKAWGQRQSRNANELSIRQQLDRIDKILEEAEKCFQDRIKLEKDARENSPAAARKPRRWFKGLGQIAQGSALSIANVAMAVGALHFPVSPETQTWGAVASVTTGVGTVLNGVGDLRNE